MAEDSIARKDLLPQLKKIDCNQWLKAAERLNLKITQAGGGTSHYAIRLQDFAVTDIRGLVATVYRHMNKITSVNQKTFKLFLRRGIAEADLWVALDIHP